MKKPMSVSKLVAALQEKMPIITVTNEKGGVGKTTTSFHLVELCLSLGLKVCAIDNDPQANFTKVLIGHEELSEEYLTDNNLLTSADLYNAELPKDFGLYQPREGLTILAGTSLLDDVDQMDLMAAGNPSTHIKSTLGDVFDVVVIDTPPTKGNRQIASQIAASHLVMPMEVDAFSIDGLISTIERLNYLFEELEMLAPAMFLVPNRCNTRSKTYHVNIEEIRNSGIFTTDSIIQRQPIADAVSNGHPVWKVKKGDKLLAVRSDNARKAAKNITESLMQILNEVAA